MERQDQSSLLDAYFDRREDLRRFFAARFGSPEQAEDLVQDLYLKVKAMDPAQPIDNPGGYLYRLAMNMMLDQTRAQSRSSVRDAAWRQVHHQTRGDEDVADEPDMEGALTARRRLAVLLAALDDLPLQTQRVFRLHKFEGLTHAETAARLGMSRRMVEKHISNALKKLLSRMGSQ